MVKYTSECMEPLIQKNLMVILVAVYIQQSLQHTTKNGLIILYFQMQLKNTESIILREKHFLCFKEIILEFPRIITRNLFVVQRVMNNKVIKQVFSL